MSTLLKLKAQEEWADFGWGWSVWCELVTFNKHFTYICEIIDVNAFAYSYYKLSKPKPMKNIKCEQ